jgi:hypothetical protein
MRTALICAVGLLFPFLPLASWAQGTCVSGYLTDARSSAPVRFAAVQLQHDGAGTVADEYGYFEVESATAWDRDTLLVLTGEVRSAYPVARSHSSGLRLAVRPVTARRRQPKTRAGASSREVAPLRAMWGIPGAQYAFLVKNDAPTRRGTLRTVSFYIGDGALPREVFRLRLYAVAGNAPGPDILTENVLLGAPRNNQWYTLNLASYQMPVPETGYFVALEYFADEGVRNTYTDSILEDYTPTGPLMRPVVEADARAVWYNNASTGWTLLPLHNGLFGRYGAMMKLEVDPTK